MDVIVVQLYGSKVWRIEQPSPVFQLPPTDVTLPLGERHFSKNALRSVVTLRPGDVLYLPRGVIHNTTASDAASGSLHLSIGVESSPRFTFASWAHFLVANRSKSWEGSGVAQCEKVFPSTPKSICFSATELLHIVVTVANSALLSMRRSVAPIVWRKGSKRDYYETARSCVFPLAQDVAQQLQGLFTHAKKRWLKLLRIMDQDYLARWAERWFRPTGQCDLVETSLYITQRWRSHAQRLLEEDSEGLDWLLKSFLDELRRNDLDVVEQTLRWWHLNELEGVHQERIAFAEWATINSMLVEDCVEGG
jgi:hypothetical protein